MLGIARAVDTLACLQEPGSDSLRELTGIVTQLVQVPAATAGSNLSQGTGLTALCTQAVPYLVTKLALQPGLLAELSAEQHSRQSAAQGKARPAATALLLLAGLAGADAVPCQAGWPGTTRTQAGPADGQAQVARQVQELTVSIREMQTEQRKNAAVMGRLLELAVGGGP